MNRVNAPAPPSLTLACPACRYDLRGLPDGPCPECGRAFTLAELLRPRPPLVWRSVLTGLLVGFGVVAGMGATLGALGGPPREGTWRSPGVFVLAVVAWAFALGVVAAQRAWLLRRPGAVAVVLAAPAAVGAASLVTASQRVPLDDLAIFAVAPAAALWALCALTPGARRGMVPLGAGVALGVPTAAVALAWAGTVGGTWSRVQDPRAWFAQVYAQYPLKSGEAGWLIGGLLALSAALLCTGVARTYGGERT